MYNIINKLPQAINIISGGKTIVLRPYSIVSVDEINKQIKNLEKRGFIRLRKVKNK